MQLTECGERAIVLNSILQSSVAVLFAPRPCLPFSRSFSKHPSTFSVVLLHSTTNASFYSTAVAHPQVNDETNKLEEEASSLNDAAAECTDDDEQTVIQDRLAEIYER